MDNKLIGYPSFVEAHHNLDLQPNPNQFYMHVHDRLEILYFIRGKAEFLVEGNIYTLRPNDLLITRQSESHKIQVDPNVPYERIAIHLTLDFLPLESREVFSPFLSRQLGRLNHYTKKDFDSEHYISCLNSIRKFVDRDNNKVLMCGNIVALLGEIYNSFYNRTEEKPLLRNNDISIKIVEYVNEHLFEELSLEKVSNEFYLSVSQVNRTFKKATGSTLWDYVMIKRLLAAREAIFSGENATKACNKCGFSDYSSFYRAYKRKFGYSPKQSLSQKEKK